MFGKTLFSLSISTLSRAFWKNSHIKLVKGNYKMLGFNEKATKSDKFMVNICILCYSQREKGKKAPVLIRQRSFCGIFKTSKIVN